MSGSPQHLVRPISVSVCVKKCLITDDPRLPVIKVDAAIPKLSISISGEEDTVPSLNLDWMPL